MLLLMLHRLPVFQGITGESGHPRGSAGVRKGQTKEAGDGSIWVQNLSRSNHPHQL